VPSCASSSPAAASSKSGRVKRRGDGGEERRGEWLQNVVTYLFICNVSLLEFFR
jgi:hypothetical protein